MSDHNFILFAQALATKVTEMQNSGDKLFNVSIPDKNFLWDMYLFSFPEGTNPIFKTNTVHDGNYDKAFVRAFGGMVQIKEDLSVDTIWNLDDIPEPYHTVALALHEGVQHLWIDNVFLKSEREYGHEPNVKETEHGDIHFHHMLGSVDHKFYAPDPGSIFGRRKAQHTVFKGGLDKIKPHALVTILNLINDNLLYRGEEHKRSVEQFAALLQRAHGINDPIILDRFIWLNAGAHSASFKNTVMGTLAVSLSDDMDLETAVGKYEAMVAPENYKRPKALITKRMAEDALKTLRSHNMEHCIDRRMARLSDISVNNVLFENHAAQNVMKDGLLDLLVEEVKPSAQKVDPKKATKIDVDDFVADVLPSAVEVELFVDPDHMGNFVTLTAPDYGNPGGLFAWDNDFAWSYDGNLADSSIKQKVQKAGGKTDAPLRVSLAWQNTDDLDLHIVEPCGNRISFSSMRGHHGELDVDMNAGGGLTTEPVENIFFHKVVPGIYRVEVDMFAKRNSHDIGFDIEIAYLNSEEHQLSFNYIPGKKEFVCEFKIDHQGKLTFVKTGQKVDMFSQGREYWGVKSKEMARVSSIMWSPNHWNGQKIGNRHLFFMLEGCKNPNPARGIYNEFLNTMMTPHRKVFEVLASKTQCEPTDDQLSGLGFSSTQPAEVTVMVKTSSGSRPYTIQF